MKWEYVLITALIDGTRVWFDRNEEPYEGNLEQAMSHLGKNGWELTTSYTITKNAVNYERHRFKRELG